MRGQRQAKGDDAACLKGRGEKSWVFDGSPFHALTPCVLRLILVVRVANPDRGQSHLTQAFKGFAARQALGQPEHSAFLRGDKPSVAAGNGPMVVDRQKRFEAGLVHFKPSGRR